MFTRFKGFNSAMYWTMDAQNVSIPNNNGTIIGPAGNQVDAFCNSFVRVGYRHVRFVSYDLFRSWCPNASDNCIMLLTITPLRPTAT